MFGLYMVDDRESGAYPYFPDILAGVGDTRVSSNYPNPSIYLPPNVQDDTTISGGRVILSSTNTSAPTTTSNTPTSDNHAACNCLTGTPVISNSGDCGCINNILGNTQTGNAIQDAIQQHPLAVLGVIGLAAYLLLSK